MKISKEVSKVENAKKEAFCKALIETLKNCKNEDDVIETLDIFRV